MPEEERAGEKTEQPSPRRRQKAREEGRVARSRELASMFSMLGILLAFYFGGGWFMKNMSSMTGMLLGFRFGVEPLTALRYGMIEMLIMLAPFFMAGLAFSVFANIIQGGFVFKPIKFEIEKLNPLEGLKRFFSLDGLMGSLKSIIKFAIGSYIFYYFMKKLIYSVPMTLMMSIPGIQDFTARHVGKAVAYAFLTFFVLGVLDYLNERWSLERSLKMTKDEAKEEYKESEGNPQIKARIRSIQKEMARRRMMQEVPKATVVITNPTHIAVALRYERAEMSAPKVVAKGAELIAETIRETARRHGVPIVEDKPLARALYKVEMGAYIPEKLYRAVAKILAYIYKLRGAAA